MTGERVWVEVRVAFADTRKPGPPLELTDPEYVQAASAATSPRSSAGITRRASSAAARARVIP